MRKEWLTEEQWRGVLGDEEFDMYQELCRKRQLPPKNLIYILLEYQENSDDAPIYEIVKCFYDKQDAYDEMIRLGKLKIKEDFDGWLANREPTYDFVVNGVEPFRFHGYHIEEHELLEG